MRDIRMDIDRLIRRIVALFTRLQMAFQILCSFFIYRFVMKIQRICKTLGCCQVRQRSNPCIIADCLLIHCQNYLEHRLTHVTGENVSDGEGCLFSLCQYICFTVRIHVLSVQRIYLIPDIRDFISVRFYIHYQ